MKNITTKLFAGVAALAIAGAVATPAFAGTSISVKANGPVNTGVALINGEYVSMGISEETGHAMMAHTSSSLDFLTKRVEHLFNEVPTDGDVTMKDNNIDLNYDIKSNGAVAFDGNVNQVRNIMAQGDITFAGTNTQTSEAGIVYSANGNIYVGLSRGNCNANGFFYAPHGTVFFYGQYNNLNNTCVVAEDVVFADAIANVNGSARWNSFITSAAR